MFKGSDREQNQSGHRSKHRKYDGDNGRCCTPMTSKGMTTYFTYKYIWTLLPYRSRKMSKLSSRVKQTKFIVRGSKVYLFLYLHVKCFFSWSACNIRFYCDNLQFRPLIIRCFPSLCGVNMIVHLQHEKYIEANLSNYLGTLTLIYTFNIAHVNLYSLLQCTSIMLPKSSKCGGVFFPFFLRNTAQKQRLTNTHEYSPV